MNTTDDSNGHAHPLAPAAPVVEDEPQTEVALNNSDQVEDPPAYESVVLGHAGGDPLPAQNEEPENIATAAATTDGLAVGSGVYGAPVNPDFDISVTEPVRQGEGVAAYVSYKVITRSRLPAYAKRNEHVVIRRFRDFTWLQRRLRKEYRGVVVPPLPEKNVLEKYKMTTDFIDQRRFALEIFLRRVTAHPALKRSPDLQLFLEASETEFAIEVSRTQEDSQTSTAAAGASGAAKKISNGAVRLFRSLGSSAGGLVTSRPIIEEDDDPEYLRVKAYIDDLEPQLAEVHRQAARLVKQQADLGNAIADFAAAMAALGREDSSSLFSSLEEGTKQASKLCLQSSGTLAEQLEVPMKEFYRGVRAAKKVTADRAAALSAKSQALADVDFKRNKLARLRITPGIKEEKIAEAEREVMYAQRASQAASEVYADMSARMKSELARFQRERAREITWVLRDFAAEEKRSADAAADVWKLVNGNVSSSGG